jgi:uroporphyrinogen-III decarboxylase
MCIAGDMPVSLLQSGTPEQVKAYTKKLIDEVGKGGGYIMTSNTALDDTRPDLVKVWMDYSKEYGVY